MAAQRLSQNYRLLWVDANIRDCAETQLTLEQLTATALDLDTFTKIDDCVRFLDQIKNERGLIITSGSFGPELLKQIHHLPQVYAVYIICSNPDYHQSWDSQWWKIKGVHNAIKPLCDRLRVDVEQIKQAKPQVSSANQDTASEQESTTDLNRLEPSFMYTTLLKRIILSMKHEPDERQATVNFFRTVWGAHPPARLLQFINEFNLDYQPNRAIYLFTKHDFLYQTLNQALRLCQLDIIIDMGFFIHDLHRQIEQLHRQQFSDYHGPPLTVYRGQLLSTNNFTTLQKSQRGLIAFNSFLSTSRLKELSLVFAQPIAMNDNSVGILFVMTVNPKVRSVKFADISAYDSYPAEQTILFSMHTIFRIGDIIKLDETQRLFEVRLTLTDEDDPDLSRLTDRIEADIGDGAGWVRLGQLLLDIGQLKKAEEIYLALLEQEPSEQDQSLFYHYLGLINDKLSDYHAAMHYHERAISIRRKKLAPTDSTFASSYSYIGSLYSNMGDYSQAFSYHNKALLVRKNTLSDYHPDFAISYNNIGEVYCKLGGYSQALSFHNKALLIQQKTLPTNHPAFAKSHKNIGEVYAGMGDYAQALSYHAKALAIRERTLTENHPDLAISYNDIGELYSKMGEYTQALSFHNKALHIRQRNLPATHPDLGTSYNDIGAVYYKIQEYLRAKSLFLKACEIRERCLPSRHPDIQTSREWLDNVNKKLMI